MNGGRRTRVGQLGAWLRIGFPLMLAGIAYGDEPVIPLDVEATRLDVRVIHRIVKGGVGGTECALDADCVDDNPCTQDICVSGSCVNRPISGCVRCEPSMVCPPLDVVFIMDTSGSMKDEAAALCASIDRILADLSAADVTVRAALLGITETPGTFGCLTNNVVSLLGGTVPGDSSTCPFPGSPSAFESWGPATAIVADRYDWAVGAARIIVPLADEGPCNGNRPDGCNDPGNDRDSIVNAVAVARANDVIVSPITGTGSSACVTTLASALAAGTGGTAFATQDAGAQLPGAVVDLLLALCEFDDTCDDGNFCTRDDVCVDGVCVGTPIPNCWPCTPADMTCSDGNACTDDACNDDMDCVTTPNYDAGADCCDPDDGVLTPIDDDDACTADACDPVTGQVDHDPMPDGTSCDDGSFCTVGDACTGGVCRGSPRDCTHLSDACNRGVCDENADACRREVTNENGPCNDQNACTTADRCVQGVCVGGPPLNCNDNNVCTNDTCDPSTGCVRVNNTAPCEDGNACTVDDRCATGRCVSGPPRNCNDGNVCTTDYCLPTQGCVHIPNYNPCDDGNLCTEDDVCYGGVCSGVERECDDYDVCNGEEYCDPKAGTCQAGTPLECDDGDACTQDSCDRLTGCVNTPITCDDGNSCTDDGCDPAVGCVYADNTLPCDDQLFCTLDDMCRNGMCGGSPRDCSELDDMCFVGVCNEEEDACLQVDVECPQLRLEAVPGVLSEPGSYFADEDVRVNIMLYPDPNNPDPVRILGGQFYISYDPTVLRFREVMTGQKVDPNSPFKNQLQAIIDHPLGTIFYAVGMDPFGGPSQATAGPAVMAGIAFEPIVPCGDAGPLCFLSDNPRETLLVDDRGYAIEKFEECCFPSCLSLAVHTPITMNCPGSVFVNADANGVTALVRWNPVEPITHCHEEVDWVCTATNNLGANVNHLVRSGGVFPSGLSQFRCTATSEWGDEVSCSWSVHVSPANLVEVSLQLSPAMVSGPLTRCIEFEFYANCIEPPTIAGEVVDFGLPYNLPGHADNVLFKIPAGRYMCVAARDPLHTLRSVAVPEIVDRKFVAIFKGDPFFGGNWLVGGNINGDHVIDILDFGVFNAHFGREVDPDTPCGTPGPHADINGDGMVDALDLSFIQRNLTLADKGSCCPGGQTAAAPILEISIPELEAMGLGDLRQADIDGNGLLNEADITAFMEGMRAAKSTRGLLP